MYNVQSILRDCCFGCTWKPVFRECVVRSTPHWANKCERTSITINSFVPAFYHGPLRMCLWGTRLKVQMKCAVRGAVFSHCYNGNMYQNKTEMNKREIAEQNTHPKRLKKTTAETMMNIFNNWTTRNENKMRHFAWKSTKMRLTSVSITSNRKVAQFDSKFLHDSQFILWKLPKFEGEFEFFHKFLVHSKRATVWSYSSIFFVLFQRSAHKYTRAFDLVSFFARTLHLVVWVQ